jgi:hypothetical protein
MTLETLRPDFPNLESSGIRLAGFCLIHDLLAESYPEFWSGRVEAYWTYSILSNKLNSKELSEVLGRDCSFVK